MTDPHPLVSAWERRCRASWIEGWGFDLREFDLDAAWHLMTLAGVPGKDVVAWRERAKLTRHPRATDQWLVPGEHIDLAARLLLDALAQPKAAEY